MTVINNATLILKDSQGNEGIVKSFTDNDIDKISNAITDVGQVVDPATHMPIEATKTSAGVVQLATATDIENGTAGKVVDAQELNNFAQTLPAANGVTDVSSGDNSNQLVVSRIGGSKTLTIDNVEHADNADEATHATQADTATSANSVAWDNVSGKPSSYTPSSHTHDDRYYTESEIDTKLSGKSDTTHNHNSAYLGISAKAESAKSADSVAWANVSGKPTKVSQFTNDSGYITGITKAMVTTALGYTPPTSDTNTHYTTTLYAGAKDAKSNAATTNGNTYIKLYDDSTVRSQLNIKGSGATSVTTDANGVITISSTDNNTTYSKLSQFTNDSGYITSSGTAATISQKVDSSAKTHTNYNTNGTYVPTMNFLSYWNGAYSSGNASNLTYCAQGTIIGSNNIGSQSVKYANSAGSVAWSNVSSRPTKVSQFTNDSKYITGITKAMVTNALGYTPPTTNTTYSAGTGLALNGTSFNVTLSRVAKNSKSIPGVNKVIFEEYSAGTNYNLPSNHWYHIITMEGSDANYATQLALGMSTTAAYYRCYNNKTWSDWKSIINTNTWNALKGSTTSAAGTAGYAPAPAAGAANRYLRCDGTWQVPPDNNTTYSVATTSANGLMSSSDKTKLNKCITTDSIWIG